MNKHTPGNGSLIERLGDVSLDLVSVIGFWLILSLIAINLLKAYSESKHWMLIKQFNNRKVGPIFGALLGLIPGCAGTVFITGLYQKKEVPFSVLVTTFIVTTGEVALVILFRNVMIWISVLAFLVPLGIIIGYILGIPKIENFFSKYFLNKKPLTEAQKLSNVKSLNYKPFYHLFFYLSFIFFLPAIYFSFVPEQLRPHWIEGDFFKWSAFAYFISIALLHFFKLFYEKIRRAKHTHHHHHKKKLNAIGKYNHEVEHLMDEIFTIFTWLFITFIAIETILFYIGRDNFERFFERLTSSYGLIPIGILIGLIPVCSPSIVFAVVLLRYTNNPTPIIIASFIANSIANAGDAPTLMFQYQKKHFLIVNVMLTVLALLIGFIALPILQAII